MYGCTDVDRKGWLVLLVDCRGGKKVRRYGDR